MNRGVSPRDRSVPPPLHPTTPHPPQIDSLEVGRNTRYVFSLPLYLGINYENGGEKKVASGWKTDFPASLSPLKEPTSLL